MVLFSIYVAATFGVAIPDSCQLIKLWALLPETISSQANEKWIFLPYSISCNNTYNQF